MTQGQVILSRSTDHSRFWIADLFFVLCAALYAWLAWRGVDALSGHGLLVDSDLQTYIQGMAGEKLPELFASDPVLWSASPANSIPNLQRCLAGFFLTGDNFAEAFLLSCSLCVFFYLVFWYAFGRWFFRRPVLAALLSLTNSMTIWVGWGTFWGMTHSDPLPRVFFGALFPLLLGLAIAAVNRPWLRVVACVLAGLCMWVHGVSALACGAMFCGGFLLCRAEGVSWGAHLWNTGLCCAGFLLPVLVFLWPSLMQHRQFTPAELDMFRELMNVRWAEDFAGFGRRILEFLNPVKWEFFLYAAAVAGWISVRKSGDARWRQAARLYPGFLLALVFVTFFCWLESRLAPELGRLPMGHELVRCLRFVVPLAWIMTIALIGLKLGTRLRVLCLVGLLGVVWFFDGERQTMAVRESLHSLIRGQTAQTDNAELQRQLAALAAVAQTVPEGQPVHDTHEEMAVRYWSRRPLIHAFKDGYVYFYNKDADRSAQWLEIEKLKRGGADAIEVWLATGAPWLLAWEDIDPDRLPADAQIVVTGDGWAIAHRNQ